MQQSVEKGLAGMTKSFADFTNRVAGFNKNSGEESSKDILKSLGSIKSSFSDDASTTALDMIVNGFKEGSASMVKAVQETGATLANIKAPEVQRKPTSLDILSANAGSTNANAIADAMATRSEKSDLIPRFGDNPIGYGGNSRKPYNIRDTSSPSGALTSSADSAPGSGSGATQPAQGQAHSAQ